MTRKQQVTVYGPKGELLEQYEEELDERTSRQLDRQELLVAALEALEAGQRSWASLPAQAREQLMLTCVATTATLIRQVLGRID